MPDVISVVIPLYNKARHIRRALDSVLAQTSQDLEVIVVNDGSTDGSDDVVRRYTEPRLRLVNQENAGASAARNRGIAEARADLIAFLDADDEWLQGHLATIVRLSERFPECGAYATAYEMVDRQDGRRRPEFAGVPPPPWEGVIANYFHLCPEPICSSSVAVPKRVFDSVGPFPIGVQRGEDSDMWCRIALKYPIAFSTRVGAVYHQEADNRICVQCPAPLLQEHCFTRLVDDALKSGNRPPGTTPNDLVEYRNWKFTAIADELAAAGNAAGAREYLRRAVSTRRHRLPWMRAWMLSFVPASMRAALRKLRRAGGDE